MIWHLGLIALAVGCLQDLYVQHCSLPMRHAAHTETDAMQRLVSQAFIVACDVTTNQLQLLLSANPSVLSSTSQFLLLSKHLATALRIGYEHTQVERPLSVCYQHQDLCCWQDVGRWDPHSTVAKYSRGLTLAKILMLCRNTEQHVPPMTSSKGLL